MSEFHAMHRVLLRTKSLLAISWKESQKSCMTGWCSSMLPDNQQKTEIAQNAVDAFSYDHPEVFWIYNVKYSYRISGQSTETGCLVKIAGITLKPQEVIMKPIIKI